MLPGVGRRVPCPPHCPATHSPDWSCSLETSQDKADLSLLSWQWSSGTGSNQGINHSERILHLIKYASLLLPLPRCLRGPTADLSCLFQTKQGGGGEYSEPQATLLPSLCLSFWGEGGAGSPASASKPILTHSCLCASSGNATGYQRPRSASTSAHSAPVSTQSYLLNKLVVKVLSMSWVLDIPVLRTHNTTKNLKIKKKRQRS